MENKGENSIGLCVLWLLRRHTTMALECGNIPHRVRRLNCNFQHSSQETAPGRVITKHCPSKKKKNPIHLLNRSLHRLVTIPHLRPLPHNIKLSFLIVVLKPLLAAVQLISVARKALLCCVASLHFLIVPGMHTCVLRMHSHTPILSFCLLLHTVSVSISLFFLFLFLYLSFFLPFPLFS